VATTRAATSDQSASRHAAAPGGSRGAAGASRATARSPPSCSLLARDEVSTLVFTGRSAARTGSRRLGRAGTSRAHPRVDQAQRRSALDGFGDLLPRPRRADIAARDRRAEIGHAVNFTCCTSRRIVHWSGALRAAASGRPRLPARGGSARAIERLTRTPSHAPVPRSAASRRSSSGHAARCRGSRARRPLGAGDVGGVRGATLRRWQPVRAR
jgi:hypothetical protein